MRFGKYVIGFSFLLLLAVSAAVYAQFDQPDDAIEYREATMFLIGHHFSKMGSMVKGEVSYDKNDFEKHAKLVDTLSSIPWDAFMVQGSEKGKAKRKTTMNDKVFKEKEQFTKLSREFTSNTVALYDAARWGEMKMIQSLFSDAAQKCKGCHTQYRTK